MFTPKEITALLSAELGQVVQTQNHGPLGRIGKPQTHEYVESKRVEFSTLLGQNVGVFWVEAIRNDSEHEAAAAALGFEY